MKIPSIVADMWRHSEGGGFPSLPRSQPCPSAYDCLGVERLLSVEKKALRNI